MRSDVPGSPGMDAWQRAEVENEARSRARNEGTRIALDEAGLAHRWETYRCECGDASCVVPITMTRPEYEGVRAEATQFAIASNHENPELDLVIAEHARYTVVRKWFREAARIAYDTDPRA